MGVHAELASLSATEMRRLISEGQVSPVEIVEACLDRIERHNGTINAVVTLSETAIDEAKELERHASRGERLGRLHGIPVGIKDVTPVAGLRTTFGSQLYADYVPDEDALVVERLRKAGAIIIGKTNCPEFAAGGNTFNDVFGPTRNPWNTDRSAGGSTGGGAAGLATGMIALAEGTDLGGSLRIPAAFCGVVGLRPSPGLVPTHPNDFLWDNLVVTGPMARTAEDVALMLQAVCGPDPRAPMCQPTQGRDFIAAVAAGTKRGLRLAYCPDIAGIGIDPGIESICRNAAQQLTQIGADVEGVDIDFGYARNAFLALRGLLMVAHHYTRLDKIDCLGVNLTNNIEGGLAVTAEQLAAGEYARGKIWEFFSEFFQEYDHLLTPTTAVPPFPVEQNYPATVTGKEMETYIDWVAPTFTLSLSGLPVASVPCGVDGEGLPVGLQIVGRPRGEESVLALAHRVQEVHRMPEWDRGRSRTIEDDRG